MRQKLLFGIFLMALLSGIAFAQESEEPLNAARKVEIGWPQLGLLRVGGQGFTAGGFDVLVRATDSVAIVGEVRSGISSELDSALITYRAGLRLNRRSGNRWTTFVQGVAGGASGYDVFSGPGFAVVSTSGSGFSLAGGGGVDVGLKNWLGLRVVQADYEMTRVGGYTQNGFRVNGGVIFRLGRVSR